MPFDNPNGLPVARAAFLTGKTTWALLIALLLAASFWAPLILLLTWGQRPALIGTVAIVAAIIAVTRRWR